MTKSSTPGQKQSKRLTRHIIIGMISGAALGVILNFVSRQAGEPLHDVIVNYMAEGLFNVMGSAFVSLLQVLVVPLVFVSLICGTAALEDVRKLGRIGVRTFGLYMVTTALAITLALTAAIIIRPGIGFGLDTDVDFEPSEAPNFTEVLIDIFPSNAINAMAEGNMLQIIVFAILCGIALTLAGDSGKRILSILEDLNAVIMKLVWIVMLLAPYGVFALIAKTFTTQGFDAILPLAKYFFLVLAVLIFHALVSYPSILKIFSGLDPVHFLRKIRNVQIFAFSTASSNATIPITLQTVEHRLGVRKSIASFTVPLGATINMDGTAIMQGVATVFIAQAYTMGLDIGDYLMVIITATLASIGTAGVPGVGLILLSMVLNQVGLPVEGVGLIIGIDRLLDMVRTAVNVTGDSAVSCIVANGERELDTSVYNSDISEDSP